MGNMICIGDSLTYGYGVRRSQCWTTLASEMSGWSILNCGVCGDTTGGMLTRMREILHDAAGESDERCFLLMGGCNDVFYSGSSVNAKENMAAMAHQLFAEGEMPLIAVGPGIAKGAYPSAWTGLVNFPEAEKEIAKYFEWLEHFCTTFGVRMIDFRADFHSRTGEPRTELYLDGLHLNPEGHRVMAERVAKVIAVMDRETMNP